MIDASLSSTLTLPNGAATTTSAGIDLGAGYKPDGFELLFVAPARTLALLPNAQTLTYTLETSAVADFSAIAKTVTLGVQTGVTGTDPCPAITRRYRPSPDEARYVRVKCVKVGASDASGASATLAFDGK